MTQETDQQTQSILEKIFELVDWSSLTQIVLVLGVTFIVAPIVRYKISKKQKRL